MTLPDPGDIFAVDKRPRHAKALTFSAGVTPPKFLQPSFSSASGAASDIMPAAGGAPTSSCGPSSCSYFQGGAVASIPHLDQQQQPHQIRKTISLTDEALQPVESDTRTMSSAYALQICLGRIRTCDAHFTTHTNLSCVGNKRRAFPVTKKEDLACGLGIAEGGSRSL